MSATNNYPPILADLRSTVAASLIADGIDEVKAERFAHTAAERIRNEWGGSMPYIPKGQEYELSLRDRQLWNEYTGYNRDELIKKYDISVQWFYKISKIQRKAELKRRQADMFD
jgi:Mor family transcriptional regulator